MDGATIDQPRLRQLLVWEADGWQIEEPVFQRNVLVAPAGRAYTFEFVLCSGGQRRAIALRDSADVQQFLEQRRLSVLDLF